MYRRNIHLEEVNGLVYDIQKFAIHDGPGIRTLVYMKGCPISCPWCSSPQTQRACFEIMHIELECKMCGRCVEVCPPRAITLSEEAGWRVNRQLCTACGDCVDACPNQALSLAGKWMTVEELFHVVNKDSSFYRRSNGGVTVGGGEPTMQPEFVAEFLKRCMQSYIHTAIETCGYVKWEQLEKILEYVDLVYIDIKHMDSIVHRELTGVSNEIILQNISRVSAIRPAIIRIPTVPGYNDSDDNMLNTARFATKLGENLQRIELLPYHKFGTQTYNRIGREFELANVEPPSDDYMQRLKKIVESEGVNAEIGG